MIDHVEPSPSFARLVIQPRAQEEIGEAFDWYEAQRLGLGIEFIHSLDAVFAQVQRDPAHFPYVSARIRRALLRRFPYGVFFAEYDGVILVVAVIHTRRNPKSWPARPAR